jgi:DNA-binding NtrC family response regulator
MDAELLEVYASAAIEPLSRSTENRSTMCLDRFDEMPIDGQDRLVQWMQTWPDRLRLIGLLSRPINELDPNAFRPPLTDAMSILPIGIPPLASRSADLPTIAQSLARSTRLSREAIDLIESYPWPGQWDEFVAAIRFAQDVVQGDRITREHFPLAVRSFRARRDSSSEITMGETDIRIGPAKESAEVFEIASLDDALREYESELIAKAMAAADGNKAEAARRLGISRTRLLRKLSDS